MGSLVTFDYFQEVHTEDFEHHHEVLSVWAVVDERVKQLHAVGGVTAHAILIQIFFEILIFAVEFLN